MASRELAAIGRAVAERVGTTIRELRTSKGLTQAQLALPEFSISFISALERGKIRPSLRALFFLAKRLGVAPASLLGGGAARGQARGVGTVPDDAQAQLQGDTALEQAEILLLQQAVKEAEAHLSPLQPERLAGNQTYALFLLRGQLALERNAYQSAEMHLQDAAVQAEALGDRERGHYARNLQGLAWFLLGNYRRALELHRGTLAALEQDHLPDPFFALEVLGNLASDHFALNEAPQAASLYARALELYEGVVNQGPCQLYTLAPLAQQLFQTSLRYGEAGKWGLAREYATRGLALYKARTIHRYVGLTHQNLGKVRERLGDLDGAEHDYRRALTRLQELMDDSALALCYISLAELSLARGSREAALREGGLALAHAQKGSDQQTLAEAMLTLGAIHHGGKDFAQADPLTTEALRLLEASNAFELAARGYARYANQLEEREEHRRSLAAWKEAYRLRRKSVGSDPLLRS